MQCSNCGNEILEGTSFCPHCGNRIVGETAAADVPLYQTEIKGLRKTCWQRVFIFPASAALTW